MKFMLMMNAPRGNGDWGVANWPPEDLKAHIGFMKRFNKELGDVGRAGGRRRAGDAGAGQARARGQGRRARVTDGPFAEAKEFLAGYWIVDVESTGAGLRDRRAARRRRRARVARR